MTMLEELSYLRTSKHFSGTKADIIIHINANKCEDKCNINYRVKYLQGKENSKIKTGVLLPLCILILNVMI